MRLSNRLISRSSVCGFGTSRSSGRYCKAPFAHWFLRVRICAHAASCSALTKRVNRQPIRSLRANGFGNGGSDGSPNGKEDSDR